MGITANSGPYLSYGITQGSTGVVSEYNEERGPSLYDLGHAVLDPRYQFNYDPGNAVGTRVYGFFEGGGIIDCQPFAANSSVVVGSTTNAPVAGTALTLAPLSSFGAIQTTITAPENGTTVSVIAFDSTATAIAYGQSGTVACWNPAAVPGRAVVVLNTSNANSEQYIVNGRDFYGFKVTETIFASTTSTGTGVGKKAFKYIASVTPSTATTISATGVSVGFADVYGFPLRVNYLSNVAASVSSTPLTPTSITLSSANATTASTATATSTTGDVRGTFTSTIATNGSTSIGVGIGSSIQTSSAVRIRLTVSFTAQMMNSITASDTTGMFGLTQFSNF